MHMQVKIDGGALGALRQELRETKGREPLSDMTGDVSFCKGLLNKSERGSPKGLAACHRPRAVKVAFVSNCS